MDTIVQLKNLSVRYESTKVVDDISCAVAKGDFIGLVGPNGGGKTTLIKAVLGLVPISSGKVSLFEKEIKTFKWEEEKILVK